MMFVLVSAVVTNEGPIRYGFRPAEGTHPDNIFNFYGDLHSDGDPLIVGHPYELALHHHGAPE